MMTASSGHSCIDRVHLLRLEDGLLAAAEAAATREHLAACPRCQALAHEFADLRDTVVRMSDSRAGDPCPPPHVIATYAEGLLAQGDRGLIEEHLARCGRCVEALAALGRELAGLETDPGVETPAWALERAHAMVEVEEAITAPARAAAPRPAEGRRTETRRGAGETSGFARFIESLRAASFPVAATAAVAIMFLAQIPAPHLSGPVTRGPSLVGVPEIRIMAPEEGVIVEPTSAVLAWEAVPGAGTYQVTVADATGAVVWTALTADPWVRVPALRIFTPGAGYAFWVSAVLESGETVESAIRRFTAGHSALR
jgi:anti-sigma factor RsiW